MRKIWSMEEIESLLEKCLQMVLDRDLHLLQIKAKEECINHRLALYLEKELESYDYHVDLEYNKHFSDKKMISVYGEEQSIRPDILIHRRNCDDNNLLIIEAKKGGSNKRDRLKVKELLESPFKYQYGSLICYYKNYIKYKIVERDSNIEKAMNKEYNRILFNNFVVEVDKI
ncbi:hypothetical protein I532_24567 [Brevibacillus borstelensis AK1]|uniref:Type I restriction enzyme R protein N-terminal domain-containing protein n=1 Tax=Brevibacillus borstelensis AK1 TaxID=1300222 RepID=M8D1C4_9BACL|nr:hypothetical protein [Brevibacillus borstelensis]EMT50019.1 hypothetical protein I532_24567 [Brevibacillus borstelensis AK1]